MPQIVTVNEEETKSSPCSKPPPANWHQLFSTTEGRILVLGLVVAIAGLLFIGVAALGAPGILHIISVMSFANVVFGRAVSMSIGYAAGYNHLPVVLVNMWVETVLVLLIYPLLVLSMRKLVVLPVLKRFLDRTGKAARRHEDEVRRYGTVGLFVFVWFPFWMTGPVVGAAIGYLLRFPAALTLSIVLAGTYIAMVAWAWALFRLHTHAAALGPWAPALAVGAFVLIVLAGYWFHRHRKT